MSELSNVLPLSVLLSVSLISGCSQSPEPASPQKTFSAAVSDAISLRNTIRDGFAAGDVDAAHGPLHEIGYELEKIPELATTADLSSEQLEQVKSAVEQLMDAFGEVDKTLHGGEGSTYEEEAQKIDSGIKTLADIAGVPSGNNTVPDESPSAEPDSSPEIQEAEIQEAEIQDAVIPSEAPPPESADEK